MNNNDILIPPNDIEAEISILGCIFLKNDSLFEIIDLIQPEDFYGRENKIIFKAMKTLALSKTPIDFITIKDYLVTVDKLSEAGGLMYITKAADIVFSTANMMYYVNIVKEKSILRKLLVLGSDITKQCYEGKDKSETLSNDLMEKLIGLRSIDKRKVRKITDGADNITDKLIRLDENKEKYGGIYSGLMALDNVVNGFHKQEIVIIAGRPGMGKTSMFQTMMIHQAVSKDRKVLFFSLEQSFEAIQNRIISGIAHIDSEVFRKGTREPKILKRIDNARKLIQNSNLYIDDNTMSINDLCSLAYKYKLMYGIEIMYIDYIGLIKPSARSYNRNDEVSAISRQLKELAKTLDIPIVLASQLNRSIEKRENKRPLLSDLRDSGAIEQDANVIILLHNENIAKAQDNDGTDFEPDDIESNRIVMDVIIAKNKEGKTSDLKMNFLRSYTLYESNTY